MASFRQRAFVPVLVFVGLVVSVVSSLGAPLIPTIARELHVSLASAQWSLTATLVVAAVASPLVGRLGDGRHRRTVILGCLAGVVAGGVLAAIANSLLVLVAGRALQGLGLALMPLTMASAREHLAPQHAGRVIALLSVVGAAGVGLGYPITGLIADRGGVSDAFWVGSFVCLVALVLGAIVIPAPQAAGRSRTVDMAGALIIGLGLVALLIGLEQAPTWGWGAPRTLALLAIGLALLAVWARHELAITDPLVDLRLVRHRAVLTANVTGLLLGVTMYLVLVLLTQFVQLPGFGLDESVFIAGLTLLPLSALSMMASRSLPALQGRLGLRPIIPLGSVAIALAMLFFAATSTALWQIFVTMGLVGIGLGYTFAAMPGLIVGAIPMRETGSAMGFYQVSRFIGFALGSGLCVTLLRAFAGGGALTLASYRATAVVAAGLALVCAVISWVLPGRRPAGAPPDSERAFEEGIAASAGLELLEEPTTAA
jgi:MFS family permease